MGCSVSETILKNGLTPGHYFGLKSYKQKKFGAGREAWDRFRFWVESEFGITKPIEELSDRQGKMIIDAMKLLHDAPPEGQGVLL